MMINVFVFHVCIVDVDVMYFSCHKTGIHQTTFVDLVEESKQLFRASLYIY